MVLAFTGFFLISLLLSLCHVVVVKLNLLYIQLGLLFRSQGCTLQLSRLCFVFIGFPVYFNKSFSQSFHGRGSPATLESTLETLTFQRLPSSPLTPPTPFRRETPPHTQKKAKGKKTGIKNLKENSMHLVCLRMTMVLGFLYPRFEKVGVYWFTSVRHSVRSSFRPSVHNSVTLFRQRSLHKHLR